MSILLSLSKIAADLENLGEGATYSVNKYETTPDKVVVTFYWNCYGSAKSTRHSEIDGDLVLTLSGEFVHARLLQKVEELFPNREGIYNAIDEWVHEYIHG